MSNSDTFSISSSGPWEYDASSGDTYGWGGGSRITSTPDVETIFREWQRIAETSVPHQDEVECLVCGDETLVDRPSTVGICELCRQAIILFRRKVLEEMARDLMEMSE